MNRDGLLYTGIYIVIIDATRVSRGDGESAPRNLKYRSILKKQTEFLCIHGRRSDNQLQISPVGDNVPQYPQKNVSLKRSFMCLIDYYNRVRISFFFP